MPTSPRIEWLQGMPIFGALRDDTLEFLLGMTRQVAVPSQACFFREGDAASSLFVLQAGRASVLKGWQGREVLLRHLHAGDCFGEMAMIDFMPRSASVRADQDCQALAFESEDLYRLCKHDVEQFALMQMNLGREISRRLRDTDELLFRVHMGQPLPPLAALPPGADRSPPEPGAT
ncbi:MAG: cyclic nucleotide-binding domain-containing protein [Rubrivivax sp.]|nr:cyclic nucleotide-binding domain-containing protein [Rubrivivax sp.]MBK8529472.1 cyclic nucleotide-binding domain-containing protein [Rubrivivax sp.]